MDIKDILKNRRIDLGLTQFDVAKAVGVSEATVSRWESGDIANMRRSRIAALSRVLSISPTVIMGLDDAEEIPATKFDDGGRNWAIAQIDRLTDEEFAVVAAYLKAIAKNGENK